jgi:hypothetical protein
MEICGYETPTFESVNGDHFAECWLYHKEAIRVEEKNG